MTFGPEFAAEHSTGLFGHGVITAGEDVNGRISRFRPSVDGYMRFRQQGQTRYSLGLEPVGDQIEQRGTSLFGSCCAGSTTKLS